MKHKYQITLGVDKSKEMADLLYELAKIGDKIGFEFKANKKAQKIVDAHTEK